MRHSRILWALFTETTPPPQTLQMSTQTARLKAAAGYFILAVFGFWMDQMIQSDSVSKTSCHPSLSFKPHQQFSQLYFSLREKKSAEARFGFLNSRVHNVQLRGVCVCVCVPVLIDRRGLGNLTLIIRERSPASASSRTMFSSLSSINDAWYFITLGWFNCCKGGKKKKIFQSQ